jgi:hypothetical protein
MLTLIFLFICVYCIGLIISEIYKKAGDQIPAIVVNLEAAGWTISEEGAVVRLLPDQSFFENKFYIKTPWINNFCPPIHKYSKVISFILFLWEILFVIISTPFRIVCLLNILNCKRKMNMKLGKNKMIILFELAEGPKGRDVVEDVLFQIGILGGIDD